MSVAANLASAATVTPHDPTIADQFAIVMQAPVPFFLAVAAVVGLAWLIISMIHDGQTKALAATVGLLQQTVASRDQIIGTYERRLARAAMPVHQVLVADMEPEEAGPEPEPDDSIISMANAVRYLAERSVWTLTLEPDDDDLLRKIVIEFKDKLEQGHVRARGRLASVGISVHERGPEDIPKGFWPGCEIDAHRILSLASAPSAASDRKDKWIDISLDARAMREVWPPLPEGKEPTNQFVVAMRDYRLSG